ncbi:hypothetical protein TEQG_05961 [Trichophyton equinum CBS 127.97]|uniref:Uncharacterized protein n=1 Tax=Trichophyton equinum (strain ATCC MYA-4606 / CBS 127.97) TaxID=559882 RepID=F2PYE0_TRIEC|nr:hypothetical protein TEQG_05961 [Trichophyton equinum CBS 127.97]
MAFPQVFISASLAYSRGPLTSKGWVPRRVLENDGLKNNEMMRSLGGLIDDRYADALVVSVNIMTIIMNINTPFLRLLNQPKAPSSPCHMLVSTFPLLPQPAERAMVMAWTLSFFLSEPSPMPVVRQAV